MLLLLLLLLVVLRRRQLLLLVLWRLRWLLWCALSDDPSQGRAHSNGVFPFTFFMFGSAPKSSNNFAYRYPKFLVTA